MRQMYELTKWNEAQRRWDVLERAGSLQKATRAAENYERRHGLKSVPMTEREYVVIERVG